MSKKSINGKSGDSSDSSSEESKKLCATNEELDFALISSSQDTASLFRILPPDMLIWCNHHYEFEFLSSRSLLAITHMCFEILKTGKNPSIIIPIEEFGVINSGSVLATYKEAKEVLIKRVAAECCEVKDLSNYSIEDIPDEILSANDIIMQNGDILAINLICNRNAQSKSVARKQVNSSCEKDISSTQFDPDPSAELNLDLKVTHTTEFSGDSEMCAGICKRPASQLENMINLNNGRKICRSCFLKFKSSSFPNECIANEPDKPRPPKLCEIDLFDVVSWSIILCVIALFLVPLVDFVAEIRISFFAVWLAIIIAAVAVYYFGNIFLDKVNDNILSEYKKIEPEITKRYEQELKEYWDKITNTPQSTKKFIFKQYNDCCDWWPSHPIPDWEKRRVATIRRDRKCQQCGHPGSYENKLHVHHIIPLSKGGSSRSENLITLCHHCHVKQPGHEHMQLKMGSENGVKNGVSPKAPIKTGRE